MLLDFNKLMEKYQCKISGILQLGAHYGEELQIYEACKVPKVIFVEPVPDVFAKLQEFTKSAHIPVMNINVAVSNFNSKAEMFISDTNEGESSSLLEPKIHLTQYPTITFKEKITVPVKTVNFLMKSFGEFSDVNLLYMDIQGGELRALKGATKLLPQIEYIYTEINRVELYEKCAQVEELDEFLAGFGFARVETSWAGETWGDAFYMKHPSNYIEKGVASLTAEAKNALAARSKAITFQKPKQQEDEFNEQEYLAMYPDVQLAVNMGRFKNAYEHYTKWGKKEGRKPFNKDILKDSQSESAEFNEQEYLDMNPDVQEAVNMGRLKSGYDHYLNWGKKEGRKPHK